MDEGCVGVDNFFEQSPFLQTINSFRKDDVSGDGVAGKLGFIYEQYFEAFVGEQHSCGRAGAACADDDHIVHDRGLYSKAKEILCRGDGF